VGQRAIHQTLWQLYSFSVAARHLPRGMCYGPSRAHMER